MLMRAKSTSSGDWARTPSLYVNQAQTTKDVNRRICVEDALSGQVHSGLSIEAEAWTEWLVDFFTPWHE